MRIAVDARAAAEVPAGRGRYVRELLKAFAALTDDHEYVLLARTRWDDAALDERFRWQLIGMPEPTWSVAAAFAARRADAVFATNSYLLAALARGHAVTTVQDLIAFDGDLRLPRGSAAERLTLPLAVRRGVTLLCASQSTKDALLEHFPGAAFAPVVPHGVEERFFVDSAEEPYILMIGTLEPRKNVVRAVEAVAGLPDELRARFELVVAGPPGWHTAEIDAALARRDGARVRAIGLVPDAELPTLYAGATVFLYPSLREGFGLPVLEAMAAGTPVVTSNLSSLPEVGGDAAVYVDPYDVASIRAGVGQLLTDDARRARLAVAGRERARTFAWERSARETLALLSER